MKRKKYRVDIQLVKARREELKLTQIQVAESIGMPVDKYSRRESGTYNFRAEEIPALCNTLKIPLKKIFTQDVAKIESLEQEVI